jgi:hypothetical protein
MAGRRGPRLSLGEKTAPYVAPWLLMLAAMPVAVLLHFTLGNDPKWMMILGVLCTVITWATWHTWKVHKHETRVTVTLFTGAMLAWVTLAGTGTPWSGDLLKAWAVGGFALSSFWMVRHAGIVGGHDRDRNDKKEDGGWLADKIGAFKGSRTEKSSVKETEDELRFRTKLDAPTTSGDAQHAREQIAAVAGVGADQVKVLKVKGDEGKVDVVFTRAQDTSKPLVYRGPSAPGQSIAAAPLYLGRRTDGSDIEYWIVGSTDPKNPRPVAHTKCTGVTGAGKTETICTAIIDMRWRTDVVPVVADPAKFNQGFRDIEDCLGIAARTEDQVNQLIANLPEVVSYRAGLLGDLERADGTTGYKQWEPECYTRHGVPFVFIDIEEAADVVMGMDMELDNAVRKLRSVGIHLCLSMQTMPYDNIPRKTRGQFSQSLAHGQNEYQDAKYALHPDTLEAGADPTKWGPDAPGSLYAEMTGTDKARWPIDGRAVYMSAAEKHMALEQSRQFWAVLDTGTYERLALGLTATEGATDEDVEDDEAEEIAPPTLEELTGVDVNEPLTPPAAGLGFDFGKESKKSLDVGEARRRLMNRLEVLVRSGHYDITFDDLDGIPAEVGKTPGWVYNQLGLLVEAGVMKMHKPPKGKAIYTILRKFQESSTA